MKCRKPGTGIHRIFASYKDSKIKPVITVYENSIKLSLPVTESELPKLNDDEYGIYSNLVQKSLTSSEIMELTGFGKTKTLKILNSLLKEGYIAKLGNGRGTRYSVNGF